MTKPKLDDSSRAIIVTGGGTGIGREIAHAFIDHGDRVMIVGRSIDTLNQTASGKYDQIVRCLVDITSPTGPADVISEARRAFGRIDVLVNNAAVAGFETLSELDEQTLKSQVETNLVAPIILTRQALDLLSESNGTIINISSAASLGLRAMAGSGVYAATKAGLDVLTRTWSVELADRGIRVVGVAPGIIETEVAVRAGMPHELYEQFLQQMKHRIPSGRVGQPKDVAWWVVQLTDSRASYSNGSVVAVDGGLSVT